MVEGKNGRQAVYLYTDLDHLTMGMGEDWDTLIVPLRAMINQYDCIINLTKNGTASCYVDKEMYDSIVRSR